MNSKTSMKVKDKIVYIKNAKAGDKIKIEFSPALDEAIYALGRVSNDSNFLKQIQEAINDDDKDEVANIITSPDFLACSQDKYVQIGFNDEYSLKNEPQIKLFRDEEELLKEDLDYESLNKEEILVQRDYDSFSPENNPKEVFDLHIMHSRNFKNVDFLVRLLSVKEDGDLQINLDDFYLLSGYLSENIVDAWLIRQAIYISQKEQEELFNRLKEDFKEDYQVYKKSCKNDEEYYDSLFDFVHYIEKNFLYEKYGASDNFKKYFSQYKCEIDNNIYDDFASKAMIKIGYKNEDGEFKSYEDED